MRLPNLTKLHVHSCHCYGAVYRGPSRLAGWLESLRGDFPTRRAAAARAAPSTPRLVSAARVGPVVYGLLLTFRGDGYG